MTAALLCVGGGMLLSLIIGILYACCVLSGQIDREQGN